jgi:large subunit ribosomal protein L15
MKLSDLKPAIGSTKNRKRVGRGYGSGLGKTCGRGSNGQNSRSGGGVKAGFEGGQMPLMRRLPKRGFSNFNFKVNYEILNLSDIEKIFKEKSEITIADFFNYGILKKGQKIKILADGDLSSAKTIEVHSISASAKSKIEKLKGKVEVIA